MKRTFGIHLKGTKGGKGMELEPIGNVGEPTETIPRCPGCSSPIVQGDAFCATCGRQIVVLGTITCGHCGSPMRGAGTFCPSCGNSISRLRAGENNVASEQPTNGAPEKRHSGIKRFLTKGVAIAAVLGVILPVGVGSGAFALGTSTRMSDREVRKLVSTKVQSAVDDQIVRDTATRLAAVEQARDSQESTDNRIWAEKLEKAVSKAKKKAYQKGYKRGNSSGYTNGYDSGNSAGYVSGHSDGLWDGSDQLDCSDDPDVTWLPACWSY